MFAANLPHVVVVTATLETGDSGALIEALRGMVPSRAEVGIVLVGDMSGPIRTVLDASDFALDRFVARPLSSKCAALRGRSRVATMRVRVAGGAAD